MRTSTLLAASAMSRPALAAAAVVAAAGGVRAPSVARRRWARTRDDGPSMAWARTADGYNYQLGQTFDRAWQSHDGRTVDSTGSFLIGELERLDQTLHMPLFTTTWGRDIDLRTDVSMGDELSSFTNSSFAAVGGITPNGKSWIGKNTTAIPDVGVDIGKTASPLTLWGQELSYSIPELESSIRLGRPVDAQKMTVINTKHQMDTDEQVYVGDTQLLLPSGTQAYGLFNNPSVSTANVPNGASASPLWANKTPDEILADVNALLNAAWAASGYAVMPSELRLPPVQFGLLSATKVSSAGNVSIITFLEQNSVALRVNGRALNIQPVKWLAGLGAGATNRMVAYTKRPDFVRFPLVPLQKTPLEFRGIYHITTYYGRLGVVEFVYPETIAYRDGI